MDLGIHFPVYVLCVYRIANSGQSRETFILSVRWRQIRNCFSRVISVASEERHLRRAVSRDMRNRAAAGTN